MEMKHERKMQEVISIQLWNDIHQPFLFLSFHFLHKTRWLFQSQSLLLRKLPQHVGTEGISIWFCLCESAGELKELPGRWKKHSLNSIHRFKHCSNPTCLTSSVFIVGSGQSQSNRVQQELQHDIWLSCNINILQLKRWMSERWASGINEANGIVLFLSTLHKLACVCFSRNYRGISPCGVAEAVGESEAAIVCKSWSTKFTSDVHNGRIKTRAAFHSMPCYYSQLPC